MKWVSAGNLPQLLPLVPAWNRVFSNGLCNIISSMTGKQLAFCLQPAAERKVVIILKGKQTGLLPQESMEVLLPKHMGSCQGPFVTSQRPEWSERVTLTGSLHTLNLLWQKTERSTLTGQLKFNQLVFFCSVWTHGCHWTARVHMLSDHCVATTQCSAQLASLERTMAVWRLTWFSLCGQPSLFNSLSLPLRFFFYHIVNTINK